MVWNFALEVKQTTQTTYDFILIPSSLSLFFWHARIIGESKTETFVDSVGDQAFGYTINLTSINEIRAKSNKSLLLLLYKYAINNYYNKDLVNAYATLDVVKKQFDNLWDQLCKCITYEILTFWQYFSSYFKIAPLSTFKFVEPKMEENTKKEYEDHAMKTLEYVDKFSSLCFSSNK